jgi:protein O-mannosyl-transferase
MNRKPKKEKIKSSPVLPRASRGMPAVRQSPASGAVPSKGRTAFSAWGFAALAGLIVVCALIYAPVRHYDFVAIDDPAYVSENPNVANGLTWQGVVWAFTSEHAGFWIPLTWLSYMAEIQAAGVNAGVHHLTNLLLHVANSLLLLLLFTRMTGALGKSAFVAALFAVHPLHVESVAWITERKDVLSTFFLILTCWTYVSYVRRPGFIRYSAVVLSLIMGLLAKPMLVTVPFLLLLLDYWPLRRLQLPGGGKGGLKSDPRRAGAQRWPRLIWEKVPLLILAAGASVVTMGAQRQAISGLDLYPLGLRLGNALVSYLDYILKMVWPAGLAVLYPYPPAIPAWKVLGSAVILAGLTVVLMRCMGRYPYLAAGWFWYLGTLVPVIGFVQVGLQAMADRFTYVPLIGIFIMVAWGVPDALHRWSARRRVLAAAAGFVILALTITARAQVRYWEDSVSIWTHAMEVTFKTDQYHAHLSLGIVLRGQGRLEEASRHLSEAVRLRPESAEAKHALGQVRADQRNIGEALTLFSDAVRLKPDLAEAQNDLCMALLVQRKSAEAVNHCAEAVRLRPDSAEARDNLGMTLASLGKYHEAAASFAEALRLKPDLVRLHVDLAAALAAQGKAEEAIARYIEALRLKPDMAEVHNDLGALLADKGRADEALSHFSEAVRLNPNLELGHANLGLQMAKSGRTSEALHEFEEVLRINPRNELARRAVSELSRRDKQQETSP